MQDLPSLLNVNQWFPPEDQQRYIDKIVRLRRLTRLQAKCFVRLWAYGQLQQESARALPIRKLERLISVVECSHQQAADLFYCDRARGGERSAGQLITRLIEEELVRREKFDGGPSRFRLNIPNEFLLAETSSEAIQLATDAFDIEMDEAFVAAFIAKIYTWISPEKHPSSHKLLRVLRQWNELYPTGLRVLRMADESNTIGFSAFLPIHPDYEEQLYLPPKPLVALEGNEPFEVALPGDEQCYAVLVRIWMIAGQYWNYGNACQFLKDSQATLGAMKQSFPKIRNLYAISLHPTLDKLAFQIGFKAIDTQAAHSRYCWLSMPLKRFLTLDIDETMADFDFTLSEFT